METSTENQLDEPVLPPIELSDESQSHLSETKRWAKFLAIIGFIFVGLMVILALTASSIFSRIGEGYGDFPISLFIGIFYLLFALLYFFPVLYLYRFSSYMGKALTGKSPVDVNAAFRNLKALYRFLGILTIVAISFYILAIILTAVVGVGSNFWRL